MSVRIPVVSSFDPKGFREASSALDGFKKAFSEATSGLDKMGLVGDAFVAVGASLTRNVTLPLVAAGTMLFKTFSDQEEAAARVRAILEATGGEAGITFEQIEQLGAEMQRLTTFADEQVMANAALLLTFREVRNEVGYGNDVFDRAIMLSADLASLMGTDLQNATVMFGKALNDPVGGVTALRRVGVQLTDSQEAMIGRFVEAGRVLDAQKVILTEVERQFGGLAQEMAQTPAGQMRQAINDLGDQFELLGAELVPVVEQLSGAVASLTNVLSGMSEPMRKVVIQVGLVAAALGPVFLVIGKVVKGVVAFWKAGGWLVGVLKAVVAAVAAFLGVSLGVAAAIVAAVVAIVAAIIYAIRNWDKVKGAIIAVMTAIKLALSQAWNAALAFVKRFVDIGKGIIDGIVNGIKNGAKRIVDAAKNAAKSAFEAAKEVLGISSPSKVFEGLGRMSVQGFIDGFERMTPAMEMSVASGMDFGVSPGRMGASVAPGAIQVTVNVSGSASPQDVRRAVDGSMDDAIARLARELSVS